MWISPVLVQLSKMVCWFEQLSVQIACDFVNLMARESSNRDDFGRDFALEGGDFRNRNRHEVLLEPVA